MNEILYIIINKENGAVLSRRINGGAKRMAVKDTEVPHDEKGLVKMLDVLEVMGYQIERYETAIFPKHGPMTRESRYDLNSLKMISIDPASGIID